MIKINRFFPFTYFKNLRERVTDSPSLQKHGTFIDNTINEVEGMFNKSDRRKLSKVKVVTIVILMVLATSNVFLTMMIFDKERTFTNVIEELFRPNIPIVPQDLSPIINRDIAGAETSKKPDDIVSFVTTLMRRNAELEIENKLLKEKIKNTEPPNEEGSKNYIRPSKDDLLAKK